MAIFGTKTNSSLSLKELNCFLMCVALPSLRIAALTEKPASRNVFNVHAPMNPLELEMYHQIKNVIGVNPSFYEYAFMVDADTTVEPLSLNRLVSA